MTDKPILFSGPMVSALLDGRKTQTRRILKPTAEGFETPKFRKGDRLWVREAWRVGAWHYGNGVVALDYCDGPRKQWLDVDDEDLHIRLITQSREDAKKAGVRIADDYYEYTWSPGQSPCRWRPSIHMPRWASRLTLVVTDVRVQRVQDISEADAIAEGIERMKSGRGFYDPTRSHGAVHLGAYFTNATDAFIHLWDSLNAQRGFGWDQNPWVTATTFTVHHCNIDQMETPND